VVSHQIPGAMSELARLASQNEYDDARALQRQLLPLMQVNFGGVESVPVKWAMSLIGCWSRYTAADGGACCASKERLRRCLSRSSSGRREGALSAQDTRACRGRDFSRRMVRCGQEKCRGWSLDPAGLTTGRAALVTYPG